MLSYLYLTLQSCLNETLLSSILFYLLEHLPVDVVLLAGVCIEHKKKRIISGIFAYSD